MCILLQFFKKGLKNGEDFGRDRVPDIKYPKACAEVVRRLALWVPRVRPLRTSTSNRGSHSLHIHHTPGPRLHQHLTLLSSPFPGGQTEAPGHTASGERGICAVGHRRRERAAASQSPALIKHRCPLLVCDLWPFTQPCCASVSCPVKTGITPSPGSKPVGSRK